MKTTLLAIFIAVASEEEVIHLDHALIFIGVVQSIIFVLQLILDTPTV